MTMPSVREILLLESTELRGELLARGADGAWTEQAEELGPDDQVRLPSIDFACVLRAFYARTGLPESEG